MPADLNEYLRWPSPNGFEPDEIFHLRDAVAQAGIEYAKAKADGVLTEELVDTLENCAMDLSSRVWE